MDVFDSNSLHMQDFNKRISNQFEGFKAVHKTDFQMVLNTHPIQLQKHKNEGH